MVSPDVPLAMLGVELEELVEEEIGSNPIIVLNAPEEEAKPFRKIGLYGDIDEERCGEVVYLLFSLFEKDVQETDDGAVVHEPLELVISSMGGSAVDMFGVYDVLRLLRRDCTIKTLGIGKVMSAGVLLLAAGTKGERRIGKHCRIMLHSVAAGHVGELHDLENELREVQHTQSQYIDALAHETGRPKKRIRDLLEKKVNVYLTAEEAVELGIADEVV